MPRFFIEIPVRVREYDDVAHHFKPNSEVHTLRLCLVAKTGAEAVRIVSSYMDTRLTPPPPSLAPPDDDDEESEGASPE